MESVKLAEKLGYRLKGPYDTWAVKMKYNMGRKLKRLPNGIYKDPVKPGRCAARLRNINHSNGGRLNSLRSNSSRPFPVLAGCFGALSQGGLSFTGSLCIPGQGQSGKTWKNRPHGFIP